MTAVDLTEEVTVVAPRPEPKRDRYDRYILPLPKGEKTAKGAYVKPYTRVTTVAKELDNTYNLERWKLRKAVRGVAMKEDLYSLAASHTDPDEGDRKTFESIVDQALEAAGANEKSRKGTSLHRFIECLLIDAIKMTDVPTRWRPHCEAFFAAIKEWRVEIDLDNVERIYIDDRWGVAGTGDLRARWPGRGGRWSTTDLKTGSLSKFNALAISTQLAIYQDHTDTYDVLKAKRLGPLELEADYGFVIHLDQDVNPPVCLPYYYDLAVGREAYGVAMEARALKALKEERITSLWRVPAHATYYEQIQQRLWALLAVPGMEATLRQLWPATVPQPFPTDPTEEMWAVMDSFLAPFEGALQIPFPKSAGPA